MRLRRLWWLALAVAGRLEGQAAPGFHDSVTVVPGAHYAKGSLYRFLLGPHYRDLWATPIRVPVVDLATFAGGLVPLKKGGGQQTQSLRLEGGNGKQYAFRSIDKDPSVVLPEGLRESLARKILQDQISSAHPAGALVVPPILEAAGVLHAEPVIVMMPDDAALGEFRAQFGNVLGLLEERPRDAEDEWMSFAGAREVVGTPDLIKKIDNDPEVRVDARAFLAARLTDVFLGDWDRHRDQWRWARVDGPVHDRWLPIPRDRDQAFVRFDGLLLSIVRQSVPQLVNFGPHYSAIIGATWNGRDLDRRFLTELEWPVWDSVAAGLQQRLTDSVLTRAAGRLPTAFQTMDGRRLVAGLMARRDAMRTMARSYYQLLRGEVDVFGSDRADVAVADRVDGDTVLVTVRRHSSTEPYFRRRFSSRETREVRLYLQGGADSALVTGTGQAGLTVRVIGGGGDDRFVNTAETGRVRFYDSRGENRSEGEPINTRAYQPLDDTTQTTGLPHRDWGVKRYGVPSVTVNSDVGLMVGGGLRVIQWGFRKKPLASRLSVGGAVATGARTGRFDFGWRGQVENRRRYWAISGNASGVEILRWYGFGNETRTPLATSDYRVTQQQFSLAPSMGWYFGPRALLEVGPRFKYSVTDVAAGSRNAGRFIASDRPFGIDGLAQAGLGFSFQYEGRDIPNAATRGALLEFGGNLYPALLDVKRAFGELHGRASTYLSVKTVMSPTLALQVGGSKVFGTKGRIPFYEAAFVGTPGTLRGFRTDRFAGDAAGYGSAELRLHLADAFILVPGRQGVFGFVDVGRVYNKGEQSDLWHRSYGGGVWLSFLTPGSLVSAGVGHSDEGDRIYARIGFAF